MRGWVQAFAVGLLSGCEPDVQSGTWQVVHEDLPGALLSVWGPDADDVWAVGGDSRDGRGPMVLHFDGQTWTRVPTSETSGNLWWVFGFPGGPIYAGGDGGIILRHDGDAFSRMETPTTDTVFGLWGSSPEQMWAVGGASESANGFAWRSEGGSWTPESSVPMSVRDGASIWKMFGLQASDAWLVGSNGVTLHWDGEALTPEDTGVSTSLFTVHGVTQGSRARYAAVGGLATGVVIELEGGQWNDVTPQPPPLGLSGVQLTADGGGAIVGQLGTVLVRDGGTWRPEDHGLRVRHDLHGIWIDDDGGIWAVGGDTLSYPLTDGVLIYRGRTIPTGGL